MIRDSYLCPPCFCLSLLLVLSNSAVAQEARFDHGVAAEAMRDTVAVQAAGTMRDNQQLRLDYQAIALEQELAQQAVRRGLAERLDVQHDLQEARRKVLVQALRDAVAADLPPPTEQELKSAYETNTALWTVPEAYQLDAFEFDASDKVASKRASALEKAQNVSMDQLLALNATLIASQTDGRWIDKDGIIPPVWARLATMKVGEVALFDTSPKRLLVRRGAHRPHAVLPYSQARGRVIREVRMRKAEAAWSDYLVRQRKALGF